MGNKEIRFGRSDLPVEVHINKQTNSPKNILNFFKGIRKEDGSLNEEAPEIKDFLKHAKERNQDLLIRTNGIGTTAVFGKWIADHPKYIKIGAGIVLTTAIVAGATAFILHKHTRETPTQK